MNAHDYTLLVCLLFILVNTFLVGFNVLEKLDDLIKKFLDWMASVFRKVQGALGIL